MSQEAATLRPFDPRPMFAHVRGALLELLGGLETSDWNAMTAAEPWRVRDVVAHLIGDDVSRLSRSRDNHAGGGPAAGETLSEFLHRFNAEWVNAAARISPQVLRELLATTSAKVLTFWQNTDLTAMGEPVSWVQPGRPAPVWLDCARDFTEDFVHQEQMREAVSRTNPRDRTVLRAVIDTFMHAMAGTLDRNAGNNALADQSLVVRLQPDLDGTWSWCRVSGSWQPCPEPLDPTTTIVSDAETWWRLCVRMLDPKDARVQMSVTGDEQLAQAALQIVSIIR